MAYPRLSGVCDTASASAHEGVLFRMRPTSASRRSALGWHTVHVPRERTLGTIKPRRPPCPERLIAEWSADAAPEDAYPRPGPLSASASAPRSPRLPVPRVRKHVGPSVLARPTHVRPRPELVEGRAPHLSRASTLGTSPRAGRPSTGVEGWARHGASARMDDLRRSRPFPTPHTVRPRARRHRWR